MVPLVLVSLAEVVAVPVDQTPVAVWEGFFMALVVVAVVEAQRIVLTPVGMALPALVAVEAWVSVLGLLPVSVQVMQ